MQIGLRHFDSLAWCAALRRPVTVWPASCASAPVGRIPAAGLSAAALPTLAKRSGLELPLPCDIRAPAPPSRPKRFPTPGQPARWRISARPRPDADDRRLREAMMAMHHPPGWAGRCAIGSAAAAGSDPRPGSCGRGTSGWSADARAANIRCVICNHRFLPGVRVHGLCAWPRSGQPTTGKLAVRPAAACTHVRPEQLLLSLRRPLPGEAGTVRVLAGGRGRTQRRPVGALAGACDGTDADWAEREYGRTRCSDGRRRIIDMGEEHGGGSAGHLSGEGGAEGRLPVAVEPEDIHVLESHFEATAAGRSLSSLQNTTAINCTGLTAGLERIGGKGSAGILAGLAVTPEGRPPGLFAAAFRKEPGEDSRRGRGSSRRPARMCVWLRPRLARLRREGRKRIAGAREPRNSVCERAAKSAFGSMSRPARGHGTDNPGRPRARKERIARLEIRTAEVEVTPPEPRCGAAAHVCRLGDRRRPLAASDDRAAGRRRARRDRLVRWSIETWC